jgi:hypothetical protein
MTTAAVQPEERRGSGVSDNRALMYALVVALTQRLGGAVLLAPEELAQTTLLSSKVSLEGAVLLVCVEGYREGAMSIH